MTDQISVKQKSALFGAKIFLFLFLVIDLVVSRPYLIYEISVQVS